MKDNLYNPCPNIPAPDCGCENPPMCPPPKPPHHCHEKPCPPPPCGPKFPPFCPEDKPHMGKPGFPGCGPMPPVPSVVTGMDLYEAMNNLNDRVNLCIHNYNAVMAEGYKTLHNMQRAAQENGAYYGPGEVWVEEGYYADESSTYHLVHKACVDRRGEPIRIQLHLAYGNTTNSKIEQKMFNASKVEFADKIVVALPKGEDGWYGKAIWHGCPIQSAEKPELYTVGFTKSGVMRVYNNGADIDQMLRDTVVDAMGCSGVLIQNGQITDASYRQHIPDAEKQTSRVCVGQNLATREVIFLTVGNENDVNRKGLTSMACAQILRQYGCDIAVELCEGVGSGAMDKGSLMYVPDDGNEPTAYAYWFISRKCFYKSDYERELAELVQNYGACIWQGFLNKKAIAQVKQELADEIARATEAERVLQENIDKETERATGEEQRIEGRLDDEIQRATDAERVLQENIDKETQRATGEEQRIEGRLNEEIQRATGEEQRIEGKLDAEILRSTEEDKRIDAKVDTEIERAKAAEKVLTDNLDKEVHRAKDEEAKLHGEIETERGERKAEDLSIRGALNDVNKDLTGKINAEAQARIAADASLDEKLSARIDTWEKAVVKLQGLMDTLQNQMTSLDTTVTTMLHTVADIETALNNVKVSIADIMSGKIILPYVRLSGDTMTGVLNMGGNEITGLSGLQFVNGSHFDEADGKLQAVNGNDGVRVSGADGVDDNDFVTKKQLDETSIKVYSLTAVAGETSLYLDEAQYNDMIELLVANTCLFVYDKRYFYVTSKDENNNPTISELYVEQLKNWSSYKCTGIQGENGFEFSLLQMNTKVDAININKSYSPTDSEWNEVLHGDKPFSAPLNGSNAIFYKYSSVTTADGILNVSGFTLAYKNNKPVIAIATFKVLTDNNVMTIEMGRVTNVQVGPNNNELVFYLGFETHSISGATFIAVENGAYAYPTTGQKTAYRVLSPCITESPLVISISVGKHPIPTVVSWDLESSLELSDFYAVEEGQIVKKTFTAENGETCKSISLHADKNDRWTVITFEARTSTIASSAFLSTDDVLIEVYPPKIGL